MVTVPDGPPPPVVPPVIPPVVLPVVPPDPDPGVDEEEEEHEPEVATLKGDKGVRGFWNRGRECLFDVRITNTERQSVRNQDPIKILIRNEREKKTKI